MQKQLSDFDLVELCGLKDWPCSCGQRHSSGLKQLLIKEGALAGLPAVLASLGCARPFLLADVNTWALAGEPLCAVLARAGLAFERHIFTPDGVGEKLEASEAALGRLLMAFDARCDAIVALGSGTLNDLGKLLGARLQRPYVIVATAPSMDGYASATSSVLMDGLKISLNSQLPDAIVADIGLIRQAPVALFHAGLGDMLAKYISLCDWQLSALITGEHFCPEIAALVRGALERCVALAPELPSRSPELSAALMRGLVVSGLAMALAGSSRPASGVEHYFSHLWDMRGAALGEKVDSHGCQCLVGSLLALRLFAYVRRLQPERGRALARAASFEPKAWAAELRELLGAAAQPMIALEEKEGKYDRVKHGPRLERILALWPDILTLLDANLPDENWLRALLEKADCPLCVSDLRVSRPEVAAVCRSSGDIRDKYIVTRLLWDLGELEEAARWLAEQEVAR